MFMFHSSTQLENSLIKYGKFGNRPDLLGLKSQI